MASPSGCGGVKEEVSGDGRSARSASGSGGGGEAFVEGEKVLAYHGPLLYEAKVQKVEHKKEEWRFLVHYLGWSKNWDEWVASDRLLKWTDENILKQQELEKAADRSTKFGRATQNKPKVSTDAKVDKEDARSHSVKGKKRKVQPEVEEKERPSSDNILLSQFPLALKKQLIDDWDFITQLGKIVKLPRSPNVDEIMKKYLEYRTKKDGMVSDSLAQILQGLRMYFDRALPVMLLYKKERKQYADTVHDNISPSSIYGAEHLLRLFVKLSELLPYVNLEDEALNILYQKLLEFLKFLHKNQNAFFLSTYVGNKDKDEDDVKVK